LLIILFLVFGFGCYNSESSFLFKKYCRTGSSKKHELKSKQKLEKKLSFYTSGCDFPVELIVFYFLILIIKVSHAVIVIYLSLPV
jgi:hypothetical protein